MADSQTDGLGPAKSKGRMRGFVFEASGLPVPDVKVEIGDVATVTTDIEGMFLAELEPGKYSVRFVPPEGAARVLSEKVPVLEGQETEFILVLRGPDVAPVLDLEVPEEAIERQDTKDLPNGIVEGTVTSAETGEPVEGARVFVRGSRNDARTGAQGRFELELPVGSRELTVIHPNFSTLTREGVKVTEGRTVSLSLSMEKKAFRLDEIVITAPRIEGSAIEVLKERQDSASVADVLGADQISKAGDSDAAAALGRVTGVTVVGGRYVYVRGLGERYSTTLMNRSKLPSPNPEKRVVPLDLFPASTISSIVVQKTYSPELPGEFGGGLVLLRTRDIPEAFEFRIGLSGSGRFGTTFADGLDYEGTPTDFLGFGTAGRALPEEFQELADEQLIERGDRFNPGIDPNRLERLGEQLNNGFGVNSQTLPPAYGLSVQTGGRFDIFGVDAGASAAVDYSNSVFFRRSTFRNLREVNDGLDPRLTLEIESAEYEVGLTGLGDFGLDFSEDQKLRFTIGVFRTSFDQAVRANGFSFTEVGAPVLRTALRYSERMVNTNQVRGSHLLSEALGLKLDWRYQLALATRNEPDRRILQYAADETGRLLLNNDGNERYYSDLLDVNHEIGIDFKLPFKLFGDAESMFQAGFLADIRNRNVETRRYFYRRIGATAESAALRLLPADRVFADDTISPAGWEIQETTRGDDNYTGDQTLLAGYLMGNFAFGKKFSVLAGSRVESSEQTITIEAPFGEREPESNTLQNLDFMPTLTSTWKFVENWQLRIGVARTVNRPNFRELSPAAFIDFIRQQEARGNPELQRAVMYHGDIRLEWYPSPGESFSLAGFGKYIEQPIEFTLRGGANQVRIPINSEEAINFGGEFEFRKNFGFLGAALEDLSIAGNLTLISSTVTIPEDQQNILTSVERPLQGQSPFSVNTQLIYDNVDFGFTGSVLFNVFGERISEVGVEGAPDIYEQPQPQLDVVLKQRVGDFSFGLKFQNILNPDVRFTQTLSNGVEGVREEFSRGLKISASISASL
jgi:hypothetical protein